MRRFLVARVFIAAALVAISLTAIFVVFRVLPGDPARLLLPVGRYSLDEMMQQRAQLRLDRPLAVQYAYFIGDALRMRLGESFAQRTSVAGLVGASLRADAEPMVVALCVAVGLGAFGWLTASRNLRRWESLAFSATITALGALSLLWLVLAKGGHLPFALSQYKLVLPWEQRGWQDRVITGPSWADAVRPGLIVGLVIGACLFWWIRLTVSRLVDERAADRAAGFVPRPITWRTVWGQALRLRWPLLVVALLAVAWLLAYAEPVFPWAGLGQLLGTARTVHDYAVEQGIFILTVLLVPVILVAVSAVAAALDPSAWDPRQKAGATSE